MSHKAKHRKTWRWLSVLLAGSSSTTPPVWDLYDGVPFPEEAPACDDRAQFGSCTCCPSEDGR